MFASLKHRIVATLTPPARVSVREYLQARAEGRLETEDKFFWQIRLASGVFKATNRKRFDDTHSRSS